MAFESESFAARLALAGIRPRVSGLGRPHARALACANARPVRRPRVAALASARRRISARRANRARTADLVQAPRHAARRLRGIALLPRAVFAAAHARRARVRPDLPALQRNARAVRRNSGGLARRTGSWAQQYEPVHAVAHWDDRQRRRAGNYDEAFENAAEQAEDFLARAGRNLAPRLAEFYAAVDLGRPGRMPGSPPGRRRLLRCEFMICELFTI